MILLKNSENFYNHDTFAIINLKNLADNYKRIKAMSTSKYICAVLKADAYGHDAVHCAKVVIKNGATHIAVARIDEAIKLRQAKIKTPIILLGNANPENVSLYSKYKIDISCSSLENFLKIKSSITKREKINIHIKINTGMGRLGIDAENTAGIVLEENNIDTIKKFFVSKNINIIGIYTHFSDGTNLKTTNRQFKIFKNLLDKLEENGINIPIKHCCNSSAFIKLKDAHLNMVRIGIIGYGLSYSNKFDDVRNIFKPVMSLKARVMSIKKIEKDFAISYNSTFISKKKMEIAIIAIGYADGYFRQLSNKGYVLLKGKKAPILGNICMDLTIIDITSIPDVKEGDYATIFGYDEKGNLLPAEDIAKLADTINYDIISKLTNRIFKEYIKKGTV